MLTIREGRLGDPAVSVPWFTILKERVPIDDFQYTAKVLLRGFQVTYAGKTDRHLEELEMRLEEYTSATNPGYLILEASLKLRDDEPGRESLAGFTLQGAEEVTMVVDYTIVAW